MGSNVACASVPLDLTNLPKQLFCRSTSVSRSSRLLLGLSRSFLGARLREQSLDLAVQGFNLLSQDLVAGLLAEEHEEFADGTVDQPPFTNLLLTEGNEDNEDGGRLTCVVAVGSGWESGWRGIPNRCWSLFWRG
jgi:hypothetical protein